MKTLNLIAIFITFVCIKLPAQTTDKIKKEKKQKTEETADKPQLGSLFKTDSVLKFTLLADFEKINKDRGDKPSVHPGTVLLVNRSAKNVKIPVNIKVRGNFRRSLENCAFPPLLLDFDKKAKQKAAFKSQNNLKLVTHCVNKDFNKREYLIYKMYNQITKASFRVRLAEVSYKDTVKNTPADVRPAFLIEDNDDIAIRQKSKRLEKVRYQHAMLDSMSMATLAVFQYMIGNTDWSVPFMHNIEIYIKDNKKPIPVPYDFDQSGLVNTTYASPAPELGIVSVKQRLYRSVYFKPELYLAVFDNFKKLKPKFYKIYQDATFLDEKYKNYAIDYLDGFYKKLAKPKQLIAEFEDISLSNGIR